VAALSWDAVADRFVSSGRPLDWVVYPVRNQAFPPGPGIDRAG
jgi:hypothetical protein